MAKQDADNKVSFKDTLNLPRTDFPIRANATINDPAMIERWERENLYAQAFELHKGSQTFMLHDGPPYANGHIHSGHAYNKILKDIVTKSQRMMGKHVPVTPGWDCHGLPIEFKVSQEHPGSTPSALKKACRAYAQQWIDIQRQEFKQLGVVMDWDRPYSTMDYSYEAAIVRAFGSFVAQGYIERNNKTIPWCYTCQTTLATAEIEYQDRKDPSIYVLFPLEQTLVDRMWPTLTGKQIFIVVWTTTPWTLPLNRAVLVHPSATYVVLQIDDRYIIVAQELVDAVCAVAQCDKKIIDYIAVNDLVANHARVRHPFIDELSVPIIADDSVQLSEGTACVHCAPGCGPEDYEVGIRNKLEIFSPITPHGAYARGIQPAVLEGMSVVDGQIWVIKELAARGYLLAKKTITHAYPHCWRCRQGLIFRATRQWFCNLQKGGLKEKVLNEINTLMMVPEGSHNRLSATLQGRLEWCLSRQRIWGVPIPALLCTRCDYTYSTPSLIEKVAHEIEKQGIEYWDNAQITELLPHNFACPLCTNTEFKRETDILDVWFESGVSHTAVLKMHPELRYPADMYLEGKDQHRAWFQSALLTAMVLHGDKPMRTIVTHGFTVDDHGRKMSKSLGNVVSPQEMTKRLGVDGLRLWAASIDCSSDAVVSDQLLRNIEQTFNKIRNTCRFLLSNLYDFDHTQDMIAIDQMVPLDQYACAQLFDLNRTIIQYYQGYDFTAIAHRLGDYCTTELSAFYLDIIKDRLYVEKADGHTRRSAQSACWHILDTMTRLVAPILSITAEYVSDAYQKNKQSSIHLQQFTLPDDVWAKLAKHHDVPAYATAQDQQWKVLKALRSALLKSIEELRAVGTITHSLEARLTLYLDAAIVQALQPLMHILRARGQSFEDFLQEFVIVSQVIVTETVEQLPESTHKGLYASVERAHGVKCPRCWKWHTDTHVHDLCARCARIVG